MWFGFISKYLESLGLSVTASEKRFDLITRGTQPEVLFQVAHPSPTLAIWHRTLTQDLETAAAAASVKTFEIVALLDPFCEKDCMRFSQQLTSIPKSLSKHLAKDLIVLSQYFAKASQAKSVRVRLETVADDGCSKFHLDNVTMRLVVTYAGPGTQWVPPAFALAARDRQENYTGPLNAIATGDVAIFRGKKSRCADLVFHRSPPLRAGDSTRVVAVIDAIGH